MQIKYIPLINDRYVGVFDYEYSTGGHFSPIIIQTKHHKSLEDLKNHFIKIFLEMVQDDRTRGEHMTSLGKNASGIFKYFEEYTKLLIPDENKEVEEKPKIKAKKKPNKKEIKKDSSKGILEEYQEIFKKINCQDACKFETLINLFEKFNNKVRSIKNYPDRELKRPFVFNWSKSKFVFPCKNFVQFEADFLEFFKKMSRKKAYLFDLTKV